MLKMKPLAGAFLLLLFLYLLNPCIGDTDRETVVIYKEHVTDIIQRNSDGTTRTVKPRDVNIPAFVGAVLDNKPFLAVFASVNLVDTAKNKHHIEGAVRTRYGIDAKWSTAAQFTNELRRTTTDSLWKDIAAVMKGNKIYVLATSWKKDRNFYSVAFGNIPRDPFMFVGTVVIQKASDSSDDNVVINWEELSLKDTVSKPVYNNQEYQFISGDGNGIVTANGIIVFPIVMVKDYKKITSTLYSTDDGKTWNIGGATEDGTTSGSVVEGNDGKILFSASSSSGYRKVFESDDLGITWKKSPIFYGVWGNDPRLSGYNHQGSAISVPVDGKNVLLFSHPLNNFKKNYLDTLQLWLSDGQRIVCIGTISDKKIEVNTGNSILAYVDEHLYITHQINLYGFVYHDGNSYQQTWSDLIGLTPLPKFLQKSQSTVRAWRHLDDTFENIGINTKGLVGVLGDTKGTGVWEDMYNCVHATVTGGEIVTGGFRFNGKPGSGAKWPVISQGQNQLYKFTKNAFTITATVTIDTTSEGEDISLIGASADSEGKSVLIGLGYKNKEKKWYVVKQSAKTIDNGGEVVLGQVYQVAITFGNKEASVYVDGVSIGNKNIPITSPMAIAHFFIGGTGLSSQIANGISFTVKNVVLFSRTLQQSEVEQFGKIKSSRELKKRTEKTTEENVQVHPEGSFTHKSSSTPENIQSVEDTTIEQKKKTLSATSSTKITQAQKNRQADLENTITRVPESTKTAPSKEAKEESVIVQKHVTIVKHNDTTMLNSLQQLENTVSQKDVGSDNSAVMHFSAVASLSFVCALIAMIVL